MTSTPAITAASPAIRAGPDRLYPVWPAPNVQFGIGNMITTAPGLPSRTADRVHVAVAVSHRFAVIVIGRSRACPSGGWGRQTELLAEAGYRAAPAM